MSMRQQLTDRMVPATVPASTRLTPLSKYLKRKIPALPVLVRWVVR